MDKEFRDDLIDEVSAILSSSFKIEVTATKSVPHFDDPAITFPNVDESTQGTKLIETTVLFVDMRRSTVLNFQHKPQTVARLYSAFVRAMTRCATHFGGEVRGIIGDRVLVLFPSQDCFLKAYKTATLMNSVCQYVLNKHFTHNEVQFGIGIDYGRMLATKTGIRRHGANQQSYRALVWLGRPANTASKLTDSANKPAETMQLPMVRTRSFINGVWTTKDVWPSDFVEGFAFSPAHGIMLHKSIPFTSFEVVQINSTLKDATPPILCSESVYKGLRAVSPQPAAVANKWIKQYDVEVPGYTGKVYGMNVVYNMFKE